MDTIIKVEGLSKNYGQTRAVDDISFSVYANEIFGIVGPNGAGKTTCIECIEGLRQPDSGKIEVLGLDPKADEHELRQRTGIQLQQSSLQDRLKVWEVLDLYSSFYKNPTDWHMLVDRLGLNEKVRSPIGKLSGGQQQRLFIALALIPNPQLVFLDELTTGLDPQARRAIWQMVEDVRAQGKCVVLTTHFMEEAERLCDRVMIMDQGKIVALDTPRALIDSLGGREAVSFELTDPLSEALRAELALLGKVSVKDATIVVERQNDEKMPLVAAVSTLLAGCDVAFSALQTRHHTLEDVFLHLTGKQIRG